MRHQYSDATTKRYQSWVAERALGGTCDPPMLHEIEEWLRKSEEYRDPLNALRNMCVGLRESEDAKALWFLQNIATSLISELEDERRFSSKVDEFFSAAIRRVGIEDFDVRMFDENQRAAGTLHDLQLHKEKSDA